MRPRVVHVIQGLSRGGGSRSLLATAAAARDESCTIVSLTAADPLMRENAAAAGVPLLEEASWQRLYDVFDAADVVHVHFWNSPELYALLQRELPPVRLAVWVLIAGDTTPQIVTSQLVEFADLLAVSAPLTAALPVFRETPQVIQTAADLSRLEGIEPKPHSSFNVGYIGTVDFSKMHPRYVDLSAAVDVPNIRFIVCGSGAGFAALDTEARRSGVEDRFEFRGYAEDVGAVLAELDVFGYPLAPGNYATFDLALQEAMSAGVPPVVLPHGGAHAHIRHGETGLVARDEAEYPRAIRYLYSHPEERLRLGRNAREEARRRRPADVAQDWSAVYADLLQLPKRKRGWPTAHDPCFPGAAAFVESLGDTASEFAESLTARDEDVAIDAERRIGAAPPVLTSAGGGGVLHYRRHFPEDGYLRLWSGLVLEAGGLQVYAAAEFKRALELGRDEPRVRGYLARAATAVGAHDVARAALAAPASRPAAA